MNHAQQNYINDLKYKYKKRLSYLSKEYNDMPSLSIITGIEVIERNNRFLIWRLIEYLYLSIYFILHRISGYPIKNYSIGKYQLKVEYLFELKQICFRKTNKNLFLSKNLTFKSFIDVIMASNKTNCMRDILEAKFFTFNWNNLSKENIEEIALFYSRNIVFCGDFNYFSILEALYFSREKIHEDVV
ncbi:MAG: hypothetical protein PHC44_08700 [Lutispora sp.]|nr:hypothetical protein [Lutispora sp.]MDD4834796.1 hypothetical protein [Lutispora sp.]